MIHSLDKANLFPKSYLKGGFIWAMSTTSNALALISISFKLCDGTSATRLKGNTDRPAVVVVV